MSTNNKPCPVKDGTEKCGETDTLAIFQEFQRTYEAKLNKYDKAAGGDSIPGLQAKITFQSKWIKNLTAQNELLANAVQNLEREATNRANKLKEKLQSEGESELEYLESDIQNLIKFVKRIRDENNWTMDGLQFYTVNYEDLFGDLSIESTQQNNKVRVTFEVIENIKRTGCECDHSEEVDNFRIEYPVDPGNKKFNLRYSQEKKKETPAYVDGLPSCNELATELKRLLQQKEKEIEELKAQAGTSDGAFSCDEKSKALEAQLKSLQEKLQQKEKETQDMAAKMQQANAQAGSIPSCDTRSKALEAQLKALQDKLSQKEKEAQEMAAKAQQSKAQAGSIPSCDTRSKALEDQLKALQDKLNQKEKEAQEMAKKVQGANAQAGSIASCDAKSKALEDQLKALQDKLNQKEKEAQEMAKKVQAANAQAGSIASCDAKSKALEDQLKALQDKLKQKEKEAQDMVAKAQAGSSASSDQKSKALEDQLKALQDKLKQKDNELQDKLKQKENELQDKLKQKEKEVQSKAGTSSDGCDAKLKALEDKLRQKDNEMLEKLKQKEKELQNAQAKFAQQTEETHSVRRSLKDTRNSLTVEVAEKHDVILSLRRDVQLLEERCRISNKQTQFRDDMIKELRKEIKAYKEKGAQLSECQSENVKNTSTRSLKDVDESSKRKCNCVRTKKKVSICLDEEFYDVESESAKRMQTSNYTQTSYTQMADRSTTTFFQTVQTITDFTETESQIKTDDSFSNTNVRNTNSLYGDEVDTLQLKIDIIRSIENSLGEKSRSSNDFKVVEVQNEYEVEEFDAQSYVDREVDSSEHLTSSTCKSYVDKKVGTLEYVQCDCSCDSSTNTDVESRQREIDEEIEALRNRATADCNLFYCMGTELDNLLRTVYEKEKEILNQKDLIRYLIHRLVLFHQRYSQLKDYYTGNKSQQTQEDCDSLRARLKALEQENAALTESSARDKKLLETSQKQNQDLTAKAVSKAELEDAVNQVSALSAENASLYDEIQKLKAAMKACEEREKASEEREKASLQRPVPNDIPECISVCPGSEFPDPNALPECPGETCHSMSSKTNKKIPDCSPLCPGAEFPDPNCWEECPGETCHSYYSKSIRFEEEEGNHSTASTETWKTTVSAKTGSSGRTDQSGKTTQGELQCECTLTVIQAVEGNEHVDCEQRIMELQAEFQRAMAERDMERAKHNKEISNLKTAIAQMEKTGTTVSSHSTFVCMCEDESLQSLILQQQQTILNLQDALISTKKNLENVQQKSAKEVSMFNQDINQLKDVLTNTETECLSFNNKIETLNDTIENLRDSNLDLEIDNFISNQDLAILESRVLKYQQKFNFNEDCTPLKSELAKLLQENKSQICANASLQEQLADLTNELRQMQEIANEAKELQLILQRANEEMQSQAGLAQQQLTAPLDCRCTKSTGQIPENRPVASYKRNSLNQFPFLPQENTDSGEVTPIGPQDSDQNMLLKSTLDTYDNIDPQSIKDLKISIDKKQLELNQFEELLHDTQEKLDFSLNQNDELRNELQLLICQIRGHEKGSSADNDCTLCCDLYRENLRELKEKFMKVKELLNERNKQYIHLESKFKLQSEACGCLKRLLQGNQMQYEGDIVQMQQNNAVMEEKLQKAEKSCKCIKDDNKVLEDKLKRLESNCKCLQEEAIRNRALLVESCTREKKLEHEIFSNEKQLVDKSYSNPSNEQRLCQCIADLEKQNDSIRQEANSKHRELEIATCEFNAMKQNMHQVIQEHNTLKLQNEQLHSCLATVQASSANFEQKCKSAAEDLKQCLCELESLKYERNCLEQMNRNLNEEFKVLHIAYSTLNRDYEQLTESVSNLESELFNSKINQNELCLESQNIVNNVRAWLKDQTIAKDKIIHKIKLDQLFIYKLQQQILTLEDFYKKCTCSATRQRGGTNSARPRRNKQKLLWSLGSQGTSSSLVSEYSDNPEQYPHEGLEEDSCTDDECSKIWLNKVESLTDELKKSNRYWKTKMLDDYMVTKDK